MSVESNNKNNTEKDADFDQKPQILQLFVVSFKKNFLIKI